MAYGSLAGEQAGKQAAGERGIGRHALHTHFGCAQPGGLIAVGGASHPLLVDFGFKTGIAVAFAVSVFAAVGAQGYLKRFAAAQNIDCKFVLRVLADGGG